MAKASAKASGAKNTCTIFLRDLTLMGRAGIYKKAEKAPQPLRFNLEVTYLRSGKKGAAEKIDDVISYGELVVMVRKVVKKQHYDLLETMADAILDEVWGDKRALSAQVKIEKLQPYAPVAGLLTGVTALGVVMRRER